MNKKELVIKNIESYYPKKQALIEEFVDKLDAIEQEEELQRKKNYKLNDITSYWIEDKYQLLDKIMLWFMDNKLLTQADFSQLRHQCSKRLEVDPELIYPCPKCGGDTLKASKVGTFKAYYHIVCQNKDNCDFEFNNFADEESDAWEGLHHYLVDEGYLDS